MRHSPLDHAFKDADDDTRKDNSTIEFLADQTPEDNAPTSRDDPPASQTLADASKSAYLTDVVPSLCSNSVITFITNELPGLRALLTDDHLHDVFLFAGVNAYFDKYTRAFNSSQTVESSFLFRNSLSVCAELYLPLLRETRYAQVIAIRRMQLADEVTRMEGARYLEGLLVEWREKIKRVARVKEGKERGGIGMVDGKVLFGPAQVESREEMEEYGVCGLPKGMILLSKDSL